MLRERIFRSPSRADGFFSLADGVVLLLIILLIYLGVQLASGVPEVIQGPDIKLDPSALPYYSLLSLGRMLAAYILSMVFSIVYGYAAARSPRAERWLMPLLDILQSVPILSFLPIVLLSLTAILPQQIAVEIAAIVLIFTSQVWNLTFSFYQSLTTIPTEYREVAAVFRFSRWLRLKEMEMPFATAGLIWNSVMSWAGGWFFLMAAEIFTLGERDFRLPGLGAYLQTPASEGNTQALLMGIITLVIIIVFLDQLVWQPLLAWAERFKVSQVTEDNPTTSWFLNSLRRSGLANIFMRRVFEPFNRRLDHWFNRPPQKVRGLEIEEDSQRSLLNWIFLIALGLVMAYGTVQVLGMLLTLPLSTSGELVLGSLATLIRVLIAVVIALIWTIPVGVLIGTNQRAAALLQPLVQIAASIPATALFPMLLLGLLTLPAGANIAAILLMLLGTQWYLLFNIIAGASTIPQDLQYTTDLLRLTGWKRWRTLILPALFPYIITGLITASGGAWNASIVAEYTHFGGETTQVIGLGALITSATAEGDYTLLLASTLMMIVLVVVINRLVWRRLYRIAEHRFRMDQ
ncbi:ABC transporter permease subunit [Anaerolineales bacterium]